MMLPLRPTLLATLLAAGACGVVGTGSTESGSGGIGEIDSPLVVDAAPDPLTGIPIRTYRIPGANIHAGYFAQSLYVDDETFYFVSDHEGGANLYMTGPDRFLGITDFASMDTFADVNQFGLTAVLVDDWLYYGDGRSIHRLPPGEYTGTESFEIPAGELMWAPFHATHDGRYLSMTITRDAEPGVNYIARVEFETGSIDYLPSPLLGTSKPFVDHAQIHPFDPNRVLFAHEGSWVEDRVWHWQVDTGIAAPMWIHPEFTEAGHERWTEDGSDIYVVQYGQPARNIPSGLNFLVSLHEVDEVGHTEEHYLGHASLSPNGAYVATDTYRFDDDGRLWLLLYDVNEDRYHHVTEITLESHPAHPHPSWSPSGDRFQFTCRVDGDLVIREVMLADVLAP